MNKEQFKEELEKQLFQLEQRLEGTLGMRLLFTYQCLKCRRIIDDPFDMLEHIKNCRGIRNCPHCGKKLMFSEKLQESANKGERDAGNNYIPDGWYCPVCDY